MNRLTRDPKIVIHGNSCIILYILKDNDETISDASRVSEICIDFFVSVASEMGFEEDIISTKDAIDKYQSHPSVDKIKSLCKDGIRTF